MKKYEWVQTTTGHIMLVDEVSRWFIKEIPRKPERGGNYFEIHEIVKQPDHCLLREIAYNGLGGAKYRAYLIEVNERNDRREMEAVN